MKKKRIYRIEKKNVIYFSLVKIFDFAGAHFTNQFDRESYKNFFVKGGYDTEINIVDGQMPCTIAVIYNLKIIIST